MPGNYQFLTITNPSGFGQDGFPVFAGSGPQQVFFHLDLSGQDILASQSIAFMMQVVSSDWTKVLYTQNFTYTQPTDFEMSVPSLGYGTYFLVLYLQGKPTYWQAFSVVSETGQLLGSVVAAMGVAFLVAALYPEKTGRYH